MSALRDELRHLVDELPEDQVPDVLAVVRQLRPLQDEWPPPWFGAITTDREDVAATSAEILRREFGARSVSTA